MKMSRTQEVEFYEWFSKKNLGSLEDVREFVLMYAIENSDDSIDQFSAAKSNVNEYVTEVECYKKMFDLHR